MEQLKIKPIDRVREIIDYYDIPVSVFEKRAGLSNNSIQMALKRRTSLKDDTLNNILNAFSEIDPVWLLTGKRKMVLEEDKISNNNDLVEALRAHIDTLKHELEREQIKNDQLMIKIDLINKQPGESLRSKSGTDR